MKAELENRKVVKNEEYNRFELDIAGELAVIEYRKRGEVYSLVHTEVPPELRGQGIANFLIERSLEQIESEGAHIVPVCRAVSAFVARHPEWKRVLADN